MGVRVALLGVGYFGASAVLDTVASLWPITDLPVSLRLLLIVPVALEATIYWWVFTSLGSTLDQLSSRKQSAKLTLYSRFSKVLVLSVLLSAAWVTWQMCARAALPLARARTRAAGRDAACATHRGRADGRARSRPPARVSRCAGS
jgi:hypothetical protein